MEPDWAGKKNLQGRRIKSLQALAKVEMKLKAF